MKTDTSMAEEVPKEAAVGVTQEEKEVDLSYGFCGWKPGGLQVLNNIKAAVFFISLANCLQNAANGLLGVSISTLEKRFSFSSFTSSIIASSYEFGQVPAIILIMIFGHRIHRPLFFGLGMLSVGVGCLLFFVPQFLLPIYTPSFLNSDMDEIELCTINKTEVEDYQSCSSDESGYLKYLPIFAVGRFLIGLGATPILTAGITYINDCATKEDFAVYSGIYSAMSIVGPGIGVLASSLLLNVYVDFYRVDVESLGFDDSDPRWVGNWWMGYIFLSGFCLLSAIPLFGFPNDLPGAKAMRIEYEKTAVGSYVSGDRVPTSLLKKVLKIFRIRSYVLTCIFCASEMFVIIGFNAFGPKVFENLLNIPPHVSGIVFGLVLLPAGMVGTILGGIIIQKFRLPCQTIIRVQTVLAIVTLMLLPSLLINCKPVPFSGINTMVGNLTDASHLDVTCNVDCLCNEDAYRPICDKNGVQHFSPCFAGCQDTRHSETSNTHELYNCSCLASSYRPGVPDAYNRPCEAETCMDAVVFLLLFAVVVFLMFVCFTMNISIMLRVVRSNQATIAVTIQALVTKLLGTIPAPIMFGMAIDLSCALWETKPCDSGESKCAFFTDMLSRNVLFICMLPKIVACISMVALSIIYKPNKRRKALSVSLSMSDLSMF